MSIQSLKSKTKEGKSVLFDLRNQFRKDEAEAAGFVYKTF